ncbi:hypothetical protein [Vibrio agarivorans]|uniref:Bacteriophage T7 Gp4 DNA primase/helicase N-terminal domain-containing protein n=1 Tax=Vibrio agarivorans TaxID=153622 RepID=A0ABT7Y7G9_9VIBR|nr:hypothetical protein [Vibrio agarivorans]MDN2484003.1 hypothetical protein [Vibrio agarivorans]
MDIPDWTPPACPECSKDTMEHRFYGIGEKDNGWYCQSCGAGSYQLGSKDEASQGINTEVMAARFAIALLNK